VDGIPGSIFGQVSYCNAPAFFIAMNAMIGLGKITVPPLQQALDGQPCPTTHSFFIVDQDQSDNVITSYLITTSGKLAQNNAFNRKKFKNSTVLTNGSDEKLITLVNAGLGCTNWNASDLADPGAFLPSLQMNELFAAYRQGHPVALVPASDPMVLLANGSVSIPKVNAYRIGFNQPLITSESQANPTSYCVHIANVFPTRMLNKKTKALLITQPSPDPAMGINLYVFLASRFVASFANLNCPVLLGQPVCMKIAPIAGVAMDVQINAALIPADPDASSGANVPISWALLCLVVPFFIMWANRVV
jgi:hypothetical protein